MKTLLADIELDMQELKCLIQAVLTGQNPAINRVARRHIRQMVTRLENLDRELACTEEKTPVAQEELKNVEVESPASVPVAEEGVTSVDDPPAAGGEADDEPLPETPLPDWVQPADATSPLTTAQPILAERIRPAVDLQHAFSLNDRFRFARELFGGDMTALESTIRELENAGSLEQALAMVADATGAGEDNGAVTEFTELLKKYFN